MKNFIKELVIFSTPFLIYALAVFLIDPFCYFGDSILIPSSAKAVSKEVQPHLFKLIDFDRSSKKNLALGDSRTNALLNLKELDSYYDLAYGGGSLNEVVRTFWYVADRTELDTVLIGINFNLFNKYNSRFWVEETIERKRNFISYAFNKYTFESSLLILRQLLFQEPSEISKPMMTREEFWSYQVNITAEKFYGQFLYPDNYYRELERISEYCKENSICLIIWIPPTHVEFQKRVNDFGLSKAQNEFRDQVKKIADVYDFDFDSELTKDKENFKDPLHFTDEVGRQIYREIFHGELKYCKFTTRASKYN